MGVLLGACAVLGAAACIDGLTTAERPAAERMSGNRQKASDQEHGTVEAVCITSEATPGGQFAYEYSRLTLKLPASARAADGATRRYRYRGYGSGERVVLAANCLIPDTERAVETMNRLFGVVGKAKEQQPSGGATLRSTDPVFGIEGIVVNACQYGGEWPDCREKSATRIISLKDVAICYEGTCDDGLDPLGGGNEPEPPAEPEPEPCKTNDSMINSKTVQDAFSALWQASNPTASVLQRREQGGWIIRNPDGSYGFQAFSDAVSDQCSMRPTDGRAPNPPSNAVSWVHTHPYTTGELMGCVSVDPTSGLRTVPKYMGKVSFDDVIIGDRINDLMKTMGKGAIPGIVLDAEGIKRFQSVGLHNGGGVHFAPIPRCGY